MIIRVIFYIYCLLICNGFNIHSKFSIDSNIIRLYNQNSKQIEILVSNDLTSKIRIDSYLADVFPDYSRSYLSDLCEKNLVLINGKPQDKKFKVKPGDKVFIQFEEKTISTVDPENIPLEILYEDDDIIVINKPVGMVVHPAPGSPNGTFVNALLYHLGSNADRLLNDVSSDNDIDDEDILDLPETPDASKAVPKSLRPGIVHRLDKGTSGVLIAGKHTDAVSKLSQLFYNREVRKVYFSICVGHPGDTTMYDCIGRNSKNRQLMTAMDGPPGKPAISHVKTIAFDGKLSAALVRIETGRTHQIRVHLQARRTPIAGDSDYGNNDWNKKLNKLFDISRPLLHAYETEIIHPYTGKRLLFQAPIPDDINRVLMKMITLDKASIIDDNGYLLCSTEVKGKTFDRNQPLGFVPYDRVEYDEEDWTSIELPETQQF